MPGGISYWLFGQAGRLAAMELPDSSDRRSFMEESKQPEMESFRTKTLS